MANKPKEPVGKVMKNLKATREHVLETWTPDEALRQIAAYAASPEFAAGRAIQAVEDGKGLGENLDTPELIKCLREQAATVIRGDLSQPEAMLMNQATALQSLFARLTERAMGHSYIPAFEANMRMALRAQNQCRATLEALAEIKNPRPVAFVKQANIAHGPQQINNGVPGESPARGNNPIPSNELSGGSHELLPDTRASTLESRIDTPVEAVGEINRTTD